MVDDTSVKERVDFFCELLLRKKKDGEREDERKCIWTLEIIAEVDAAVKWGDNGLSFISCQFSNDSSRQDICLSSRVGSAFPFTFV